MDNQGLDILRGRVDELAARIETPNTDQDVTRIVSDSQTDGRQIIPTSSVGSPYDYVDSGGPFRLYVETTTGSDGTHSRKLRVQKGTLYLLGVETSVEAGDGWTEDDRGWVRDIPNETISVCLYKTTDDNGTIIYVVGDLLEDTTLIRLLGAVVSNERVGAIVDSSWRGDVYIDASEGTGGDFPGMPYIEYNDARKEWSEVSYWSHREIDAQGNPIIVRNLPLSVAWSRAVMTHAGDHTPNIL